MRKLLLLAIAGLFSCSEQQKTIEQSLNTPIESVWLTGAVDQLSEIIVHDIFSPPVASRVYTYPCIAAYEAGLNHSSENTSLAGRLNQLDQISRSKDDRIHYELAALYAFFELSKELVFSPEMFTEYEDSLENWVSTQNLNAEVIEASMAHAANISAQIKEWSKKDNYAESRSFPKFTVTQEKGRWKPTPPAYMDAIEPHWREMRTMVLDSAAQFKIAKPAPYSEDLESEYGLLVKEVMHAVTDATEEHKLIASFWDCNPYVMNQRGHLMFATKKITPGGHWMGITSVACKTADADFDMALKAFAHTSIALYDGFIACWDEKYRSNYIRPETFINEFVDDQWLPHLQTPPFPEHTSGHSVISTSAATVLTAIFGDDFYFVDDVELKYGLPTREFSSFLEASEEAAISRLYGGIHYMPAITEGVKQGRAVGGKIVQDLNL